MDDLRKIIMLLLTTQRILGDSLLLFFSSFYIFFTAGSFSSHIKFLPTVLQSLSLLLSLSVFQQGGRMNNLASHERIQEDSEVMEESQDSAEDE